ncbi:MAG: adenylyltransferase/cytidyltransferase family protein [Candidatus Levyibacteriota bacterium]
MKKIFVAEDAKELSKELHKFGKQIVLAGGCFDILHIGHLTFLESAKRQGDTLIILLESDETIKKSKGDKRPINLQSDRAKLLAAFSAVDYVILLNPQMSNISYDDLVIALKPAIIATTQGDSNRHHKERQAKQIGSQVIDVTTQISDTSTTKLVNLLNEL